MLFISYTPILLCLVKKTGISCCSRELTLAVKLYDLLVLFGIIVNSFSQQ